ncbi:hypothetical protein ACLKA7_016637 [Drosophila subpalustris]
MIRERDERDVELQQHVALLPRRATFGSYCLQAVRIFLLASGGNGGSFVATLTTTTTSTTDEDSQCRYQVFGRADTF